VSCPGFVSSSLIRAATPWPEFRGPTGDGVSQEKGLPVEWSESQGITWKTAIPGKAWSSPVIWDKLVWLTNATEDGRRLSAVAVDVAAGGIVHDITVFEIPEPQFCHDFNSYASSTPVIEGSRLYVHYGSAGTACLDTETGKKLWSRQDLPCDHFRGPGSSPIIHGDLLIVAFDGFDLQYVVALDKRTGATVWRKDRGIDYGTDDGDAKKAYCTATVIKAAGREQVILPSAGATIAYDPPTGDEIWRVNHGGMNASARPLFAHGLVFIDTAAGGMKFLAVRPDGSGDVTDTHVAWTQAKNSPNTPTPILRGTELYQVADNGIATCLDAKTGEIHWKERTGRTTSASPLLVGDTLYILDEYGTTTLLQASPSFKKLGENKLEGERTLATPTPAPGALFLRTETGLYRIKA